MIISHSDKIKVRCGLKRHKCNGSTPKSATIGDFEDIKSGIFIWKN